MTSSSLLSLFDRMFPFRCAVSFFDFIFLSADMTAELVSKTRSMRR